MLKFQIDNHEIERSIQERYGNNTNVLVEDFISFLQERRIKGDIAVSIEQIEKGQSKPILMVMDELRQKYE
jgi:hypothetical protein